MKKNIIKWANNLEEYITLFFFFLLGLFIFLQLFSRFILQEPFVFTEEVSRYSYVWITFIGMSLSTKTSDHIRIDAFISILPNYLKYSIDLIVNIISLIVILLLFFFGLKFTFFSGINVSAALHIPMYLIYISFPLGCLLTIIRLFQIMINKIGEL